QEGLQPGRRSERYQDAAVVPGGRYALRTLELVALGRALGYAHVRVDRLERVDHGLARPGSLDRSGRIVVPLLECPEVVHELRHRHLLAIALEDVRRSRVW